MGSTDEVLVRWCIPTNISSRIALNAPPSLFQFCRGHTIDAHSGTPCNTTHICSFRRLANTAPESCVHYGQQVVRLTVQGELEKAGEDVKNECLVADALISLSFVHRGL